MTIVYRSKDDYRVLPKAARDYMRRCEKDPKLGREMLIEAGIMTRAGKLAPPYRVQKWERELMAGGAQPKKARKARK